MVFFVSTPVCLPKVSGGDAAEDDGNLAPLLHSFDELVAVIAFVREDYLSQQAERLWQFFHHADIVAIPSGKQKVQVVTESIRRHVDFRRQPSLAASHPNITAPLFNPAAVLVDFYGHAVQQHYYPVHHVLCNQGVKRLFPYALLRPCAEPAIHGLPWAIAFRQGTPMFNQYRIAFNILQLFFAILPP